MFTLKTQKKTPKPLKKNPITSKPPQKPTQKPPKTPKTSKNPKKLKIIQTSQNNRSRWFGKIIVTMAMVGNVQK